VLSGGVVTGRGHAAGGGGADAGLHPGEREQLDESWRAAGGAGVRVGVHPDAVRRLDVAGEQRLTQLLTSDPQAIGYTATGWTVPLLQTELAKGGWHASGWTIDRTLPPLAPAYADAGVATRKSR
jgi:hypothetical protein